MAYAALVSLAQTTDLILNHLQCSISVAEKEQITAIREYAIFSTSFLEDFPRKASRLEGKIRYVASEAEDLIEYFMWKQIHDSRWSVRVANVEFEQQLERIREEFGLITGDMMDHRLGGSPAAVIPSSRLASAGKNNKVIGLDEELIAIKGQLCVESSKLEIISILGMGGIGKTTLARFAYDDRLTVEYFYIRAWITISQDYSAQEILSCLLESMKSFDEKMLAHEDEATMRDKVYKCLKGRRYLIVMDDVWSTKALDDVRNIFPNDYNGSRIILTTRLSDVATYISGSLVHEMKFMNDDQCWNLLKGKVFTDDNDQVCPSELEDVGKEIARSCSGLPLAVVLLAGVLSKGVKTRNAWEEMAKNVNSIVGGQLEKILSLSYTHLPHHLRSCFLYMGGFPEDHEVRVSRIIKMWAAEGFLMNTNEFRSLEEEAEEYLEDLVERSLVLVTKSKSNGKIKSFGLHDLVRDLCIKKAREEKFLVHAADECIDVRRLSITNSDNLNDICGSAFRTILCFKQLKASCSGSLDFLKRSKLVRVLGVANDSGGEHYSQIFELYHLRYLALPDLIDIPSAIYNFLNLQTLIIKPKSKESMRKFELEVFRMPQLRHLLVYSFSALLYSKHESALTLENLQTLSCVMSPLCDENFLKMFPNVKKLGLILSLENKDRQLYNLARLDKLGKLKVTLNKFSWVGQNLAFPSSLKKLTLSGWEFPRRYMTIVGSLPNLEVLKLLNHACGGGTWETADGEFLQLEFLLIERSTLSHWKTECSHFPNLKCLILRNCWSLKQVPYDIGDISTLEMIEVDLINKLLVDSAKKIQKDQKSYGNDVLQVRYVDCLHQSTSFEETNGKMCYMLGARELLIKYGEDPEKWKSKACADSRFRVVAELKEVDILDIKVNINTLILSSNTNYAAYLVFKLAEEYNGHELAHAVVSRLPRYEDYSRQRMKVIHLQQLVDAGDGPHKLNGRYPVQRDDGWMEVKMGSFYNPHDDDDRETVAKLWGINTLWKSGGLIIEGIEFRPEKQFDEHMLSQSQIISLEEMSGNKSYMINSKLMTVWSDNLEYWQWKACAESRFSEVAELFDARLLDIIVRIQAHMLTSNTVYAAYLVFKLVEGCYGLESAVAVVSFYNDEYFEEKSNVVHLQQAEDGPQERTGRQPVWRDDGWMEVEMGSFYIYDDHGGGGGAGEAVARLLSSGGHSKSGLIVEGFEFRRNTEFDNLELEEMSGTECYMMGARELSIIWSHDYEFWLWTACADSRYSVVAELKKVRWLEVSVKIKTHILSSNTTYAAYLVFKLAERYYGLESANAVVRFESDGDAEETRIVVYLQQREDDEDGRQEQNGRWPVWRDDGWMEVEMGCFYNDGVDDDGEAEARLMGIDDQNWKSGLIIKGIEFRPIA